MEKNKPSKASRLSGKTDPGEKNVFKYKKNEDIRTEEVEIFFFSKQALYGSKCKVLHKMIIS